MAILIEIKYPVYTIIINNPEVKNAVDGPTAIELAEAFRKFESDNIGCSSTMGCQWDILFWC